MLRATRIANQKSIGYFDIAVAKPGLASLEISGALARNYTISWGDYKFTTSEREGDIGFLSGGIIGTSTHHKHGVSTSRCG